MNYDHWKTTNPRDEELGNEFEALCNDYVSPVSPQIQSKIDYELRQAFLAGVAVGIEKAQKIYSR